MREHAPVGQLTMEDLQTIGSPRRRGRHMADLDFLETLARWKCIVVPPWVLEMHADGVLRRVARLTYDLDLNLDKAGILLDVINTLGDGEELDLSDLPFPR